MEKKLRDQKLAQGLDVRKTATISNAKSPYSTSEEETQARQEAVGDYFGVLRTQLPTLLGRLSKIPDPRNPKKIRHKMTSILIYGILSFVFQMASRREANRKLTMPTFRDNLQLLFPDLEEIPHHDTLYRLLEKLDPAELESAHLELIERLIRGKKSRRYLIDNYYPLAIDGTQKWARDWLFADEALQRTVGSEENKKQQYYVYVMEACLAFSNGMVLPLMSEILAFTEDELSSSKQDCEQKAFHRLALRLKKRFPRLPFILLLDGLYPNGPIMAACRDYGWHYMIVLKDGSLSTVWEEFRGLLLLSGENRWRQPWGDRRQNFSWVNDIEYEFEGDANQPLLLHVVVCAESWQVVDDSAQIVDRDSRHVWISSQPLTQKNLHRLCNLAARHRWGIEANILVEKHQGYSYEHCFAYDWTAMKGYHYLMRLAHLLNVLARFSECLQKTIRSLGIRGCLEFLRETVAGPWLDKDTIRSRLARPQQLRLL
jgi:hypothetical protein